MDARTTQPDVGYGDAAPSRWLFPDGLTPSVTWTSWIIGKLNDERELVKRSLRDGIQIAVKATEAGKRVRGTALASVDSDPGQSPAWG